jgi:uncharacterized membrane protein
MEQKSLLVRWRSNFLTGLFIVLPAVISFAVIKWLFGTISSITDLLLFFLPKSITHESLTLPDDGKGPIHWYWSVIALLLAILLISAVGRLARNYFGRKMIELMDATMLRIPLFNKFYSAIKQVNEAFSGNKHSFKTVVLVEFPRAGMYSVGFLTSDQRDEVQEKTNENVVAVFIPTTPNPTSGFLVLVPEDKIKKLDMSVADGVKYIVSLGSISPGHLPVKKRP